MSSTRLGSRLKQPAIQLTINAVGLTVFPHSYQNYLTYKGFYDIHYALWSGVLVELLV